MLHVCVVLDEPVIGCRDTTGLQRYAKVAAAYIRVASAAAVVYDITSKDTLTSAKRWVSELQENASDNLGEHPCPPFRLYRGHALCKMVDSLGFTSRLHMTMPCIIEFHAMQFLSWLAIRQILQGIESFQKLRVRSLLPVRACFLLRPAQRQQQTSPSY